MCSAAIKTTVAAERPPGNVLAHSFTAGKTVESAGDREAKKGVKGLLVSQWSLQRLPTEKE